MKLSEIERGMLIRIADDISITKNHWNLDPDGIMLSMRGKTFKVESIMSGVGIYQSSYTYTFCPEDISRPRMNTTSAPPVMFDPNNICE